jgi:hypothetical protein
MYEVLQNNAIDFVMGPSYMEDDVRMETDKIGFCSKHIKLLYKNQNRLGLALILKTHMDKIIQDVAPLTKGKQSQGGGLFKKNTDSSPIIDYMDKLNHSCYVCRKTSEMFALHLSSLLYLYKKEEEFREKFRKSKGMCNKHYGLLFAKGQQNLSGEIKEQFLTDLNYVYIENMKRVRDDVDWFIDKFDYRYVNEPWKNSKDAVPRAIIKTNSVEAE